MLSLMCDSVSLVARHAANDTFQFPTGMLHALRDLPSQRRIDVHQMPTHFSKHPFVCGFGEHISEHVVGRDEVRGHDKQQYCTLE